ncbi:MAG: PilZ domain-containing protein [Candidatus Omnitrophica bacterium]|nr:PilZ domain-containing protein [Candidatus Omnitrophota bacterium]
MKENRDHIRVPSKDVKIAYLLKPGGRKVDSVCKDISLTGLRASADIPKGSSVFLHISFDRYLKTHGISGEVVWAQSKNSGIKFRSKNTELSKKIKEHICFEQRIKNRTFLHN